ncbi:hypothetical protein SAMN04488066_105116 [Halorubrum aquaticum]|uniref:Uncharacterized protein n=1 Tax=Halorubrum aquaticum TaxID=387340 RepID=A0A1I3ADR0_9EURY|nr:hypothetical protein [Halorubrum aquaticum]SFH48232.1 hypothetical protein SAMN04488066_105116 [Halorubrum aquaticum]
MAHKLAHGLQSTGDGPPDADRDGDGSTRITRRRYARLGGAAVATVATIAGRMNGLVAASTDDDDPERRIRIHGSGTPSTYEVTVGGELVPDGGSSRDAGHVSGSTAEGVVTNDDRGYRFRGELHDVTVDGDAEISLDGEPFEG